MRFFFYINNSIVIAKGGGIFFIFYIGNKRDFKLDSPNKMLGT